MSRGSREAEGAPLLTPVVLVGGPDHGDKTIAFFLKADLKEEEERREEKMRKAFSAGFLVTMPHALFPLLSAAA